MVERCNISEIRALQQEILDVVKVVDKQLPNGYGLLLANYRLRNSLEELEKTLSKEDL